MLDSLIKALTEELEFNDAPNKDKTGIFTIALNPETSISIKELDPGVLFFAKIGACPEKKREDFFILLMKANLMGQGTGGASIALDENENFLTLSLVLPYDMNYKIFKEALEDFVNYLDYWKEELQRHHKLIQESMF